MGPPMIIGAALAAVGTGVSMYASEAAKNAMNDKMNAELLRQKDYQKRATPVYQESVAKSTVGAERAAQAEGKAKALSAYDRLGGAQLGPTNVPIENRIVDTQRENAWASATRPAMAATYGYDEAGLMRRIKDLEAMRRLGVISGQAQASAGVLPYEMQDAAHSMDMVKALGTALSAVGSGVGMYGALSAAAPAAGAVATPTQLGMGTAVAPYYSTGLWGPQFTMGALGTL